MRNNEDLLVLAPFTEGLKDKFKIVKDVYEVLSIYNANNPLQHRDYLVRDRYPIGVEFFDLFSLNDLTDEELSFAMNCIYTYIGLDTVVARIGHFSGMRIKIVDRDTTEKKLTVSIISTSLFDLNLFQTKLNEFLQDVLLFSGIDITFDVLVLTIEQSLVKIITYDVAKQNVIPLEISGVIEV